MRCAPFLLLLLTPLVAAAAPISYAHSGGSATVELRLNGSVVASASAPLDGMSITFDAASASISALDLLLADRIGFSRLLGYDTLDFALQATVGAGYTSSRSGTNPYSVLSGPLLISYAGTLYDGSNGPPPPNLAFSGALTTPSVPSTVTLIGNELTASFASTKVLQHGWQSLELWVAVTFVGTAVPEPGIWMLLSTGLLGLAALGRANAR